MQSKLIIAVTAIALVSGCDRVRRIDIGKLEKSASASMLKPHDDGAANAAAAVERAPAASSEGESRAASTSEPKRTDKSGEATSCPSGMVLVEGSYCPEVEQTCKRWLDPPGRYQHFRCAEYGAPKCKSPRVAMRYCIDRDEQGATEKDARPAHHVSYRDAKAACESRGARMCVEREFQFACEGEEMRPYPYGFSRDSNACNIDRTDLGMPRAGLRDHRTAVGENARCVSPFGVRDLVGNLEEWVSRDPGTYGHATLLKGSWWLPGRSTCRATNAGHDAVYEGPETGYRCCL